MRTLLLFDIDGTLILSGRAGLRALDRAREAGHAPEAERVIVIGDTPLDVECAKAGGVRALAVATGSHSLDALGEAGADDVLEDLSDTDAVLGRLRLA